MSKYKKSKIATGWGKKSVARKAKRLSQDERRALGKTDQLKSTTYGRINSSDDNSKNADEWKRQRGDISGKSSREQLADLEEVKKEKQMDRYRKKMGIDNEKQVTIFGGLADPRAEEIRVDNLRNIKKQKAYERPIRHLCLYYTMKEREGKKLCGCWFLGSECSPCNAMCSNWKCYDVSLIKQRLGKRLKISGKKIVTWFDINKMDSFTHTRTISVDGVKHKITTSTDNQYPSTLDNFNQGG